MNYLVVGADDIVTLEVKVIEYIARGYKPTGGITISRYNRYMQAVYKDTK